VQIWKKSLPSTIPQESNIDFEKIAKSFPTITPSIIASSIFETVKVVAFRVSNPKITMNDLIESLQKEVNRTKRFTFFSFFLSFFLSFFFFFFISFSNF